MANNRYGYTKGYTNTNPWPEGKSCDVRRKPEKKRRGQRSPQHQTEAGASRAPGSTPPDRSMMTRPKIEAVEVAQDLNAMRHARSEDALVRIASAMKGLGRWDSRARSVFAVRMAELTDGA